MVQCIHVSLFLILNARSNSKLNLPVLHFTSSVLELQCFLSSWLYGPSIESTIGRGKTPNVKHPLWNLDMVTRKCLAPNSSIYWIVANIPGRRTLTKPRLELTSAPNQHRKKLLFLLCSICSQSPAWGNWMFIWSNTLLWTTGWKYFCMQNVFWRIMKDVISLWFFLLVQR